MDAIGTDAAADEARGRQDDAEMFEVQQLQAMEQPKWNEARLDELKSTVDKGFERMDGEFKDVRGEMKAGFERMDKEFKDVRGEMTTGFERMDKEFKDVRGEMTTGFERMDREFKDVRSEMTAGFEGIHRLMHRYSLMFIGALVALVLARGVGLG